MIYKPQDIIAGKYKVERELSSSKMAKTYLAKDSNDNKVVVKVLPIDETSNWKTIDLFKREASLLKQLNHTKIPKYLDNFTIDDNEHFIYYLVYEYIEGKSLSVMLEDGHNFSYDEVEDIVKQLLHILDYLHTKQEPRVIHRDINPKNIIMKDDGSIYLVDFGAVQDLIASTEQMGKNTTFVGTLGYMPLEQLLGKAFPQSDLYAVGMTAIKLLTGEDPNTFDIKGLKPDYRKPNQPIRHLDRIIDMLIEPDLEQRIGSASKVLFYLENKSSISKDDFINKSKNILEANPSYRLNIRVFGNTTVLTVSSKKFENTIANGLIRNTFQFLINNSWIFFLLGFFLFFRLRLSYFSYFFLLLFLIPSATRFVKKHYYKFEDMSLKFTDDALYITGPNNNQPIAISEIIDINVKHLGEGLTSDIEVEVSLRDGFKRVFKIYNLTREESEFITTFLIKNIEKKQAQLGIYPN